MLRRVSPAPRDEHLVFAVSDAYSLNRVVLLSCLSWGEEVGFGCGLRRGRRGQGRRERRVVLQHWQYAAREEAHVLFCVVI